MHIIPCIDIRDTSLVELTRQEQRRGRALIHAGRNTFGVWTRLGSHIALPLGDAIARRWMEKTRNPYLAEIHAYAEILRTPGVYALNLSYEWGCTSGVVRTDDAPQLLRVLDWPFPELGEHITVAHQRGEAGEFYNVTWPGVSGVFQAVAPGRFSAALNQAPLRRYYTGLGLDWVRNRVKTFRQAALPPAHLLRQAFEQAGSYERAKAMLMQTPVSLPVIYILSGIKAGEGCVIERLEDRHAIQELSERTCVVAANHFASHLNGIGKGWTPRGILCGNSHDRAIAMQRFAEVDVDASDSLSWFAPPIANDFSRLVMTAEARTGTFCVQGVYGDVPVTKIFAR